MLIVPQRFCTAAVLTLVVIRGIPTYAQLQPAPAAAYALEQTVEANRKIVAYHARISSGQGGAVQAGAVAVAGDGVPTEFWAQLDAKGNVVQMRVDYSVSQDGPKSTFWSPGKAVVWFKDKNLYVTVNEVEYVRQQSQLGEFDPKAVMERLKARLETAQETGTLKGNLEFPMKAGKGGPEVPAPKTAGQLGRPLPRHNSWNVRVKESKAAGQPIEMTCMEIDLDGVAHRQMIFRINAQTKLIERLALLVGGGRMPWQTMWTCDYLDYDQPIAAEIWQPELPKDIVRIDQTVREIGLARGNLGEAEIAGKIAGEFFAALISEDYGKAGQLYWGLPADKAREHFRKIKFVRVVEAGKPTRPVAWISVFQVALKVEVQNEDRTLVARLFKLNIRPAQYQPERWIISGGI